MNWQYLTHPSTDTAVIEDFSWINETVRWQSERNRYVLIRCPPDTEIFSKRRKIYTFCVEGMSWWYFLTSSGWTNLILTQKLLRMPKNLGVNTFQTLSAILGPPDGHFGFFRRCDIAGSERVLPSPLGWYYTMLLGWSHYPPRHTISRAHCLGGILSPGQVVSGTYCLPVQIVYEVDYLMADCLGTLSWGRLSQGRLPWATSG